MSRELNSIVDLSLVDEALKNVAGFLRKATDEVRLVEERTREVEAELAGLAGIERRASEFEVVKACQASWIQVQRRAKELRMTLDKINEIASNLKVMEDKAVEGRAVLESAEEAFTTVTKRDELASLLSQCEEAREKARFAPPDFSQVETMYDAWKSTLEKARGLARLVESAVRAKELASEAAKTAEAARAKFSSETKGATCPLCGNQIQ